MKIVELTPPFVSKLLESVAHSGIDRGTEELPLVAEVRRLPLFREIRSEFSSSRLAEDCRRLYQARADWMTTADGERVDPDRLMRLETSFQARSASYRPGHFLSLVRLGLDILDTGRTGITVLERRSLHLLERRLFEMQRSERPAPPDRVAAWLSDHHRGDGWTSRGLVDLLRYVDETTGHPLIGHADQATSDVVHLLLSLHWSLRTFSTKREGPLGTTPIDLCLGARAVLTNARVMHLRLGSLLDFVLSPELALWKRLEEWISQVVHQRDPTFQLPPREALPDFLVEETRLGAFDLVLMVGRRLEHRTRRLSVDESLVALERTLHRRIHRQEARKRHMAVLLRRVFERALSDCHKRSMRLASRSSPVAPDADRKERPPLPSVASSRLDDDPAWVRLKDIAEDMEECRAWGCSTSAKPAWNFLFPGEPARPEELADLEELLRWGLDCREELKPTLDRMPIEVGSALRSWYLGLSVRAETVEIPRGKSGARRRRERTTPLQWLAAAGVLHPERYSDPRVLGREPEFGRESTEDREISRTLQTWIHRHPWDRSQSGIWTPDLRGPALSDGVRVGVLRSRFEGVPVWELDVRLGMLSRELEYRCWLGARERVALLRRTIQPPETAPRKVPQT